MKQFHPSVFNNWEELDHNSCYRIIEIKSDYFIHEIIHDDQIQIYGVPYTLSDGQIIVEKEEEYIINP